MGRVKEKWKMDDEAGESGETERLGGPVASRWGPAASDHRLGELRVGDGAKLQPAPAGANPTGIKSGRTSTETAKSRTDALSSVSGTLNALRSAS
jgi:hypothetical protein